MRECLVDCRFTDHARHEMEIEPFGVIRVDELLWDGRIHGREPRVLQCRHLMTARILMHPITRAELAAIAAEQFGDLVKVVVDVAQGIMAIGGELHSDEEAMLLGQGSRQEDLWGINLYPGKPPEEWIEFDSLINVRPSRGNRSRNVEDPEVRAKIVEVVGKTVSR